LRIDIGALVDCEGTAYWRREKALEFPDDPRNLEAARELDRLAIESPRWKDPNYICNSTSSFRMRTRE
jgi:hypothetical protein